MAKKINKINKDNQKKQKKFFSGINSYSGFINSFDIILNSRNFDKPDKIYIIKNCGGADIIGETAKIAESKNYSVEYFLSPTDSKRLDGIIIKDLKITVINENINSGFTVLKHHAIIENIIDFCGFYDENELLKRKQEIFELINKKDEYINLAYKFLKAANELCENIAGLSEKYTDYEKLDAAVDRVINKHVNEKHLNETNKNKKSADEYRFINAVSSEENNEFYAFDTLENEAKKIFYISNENFSGWHYTKKILHKFADLCKIICPDALNPENIKAIYLTDLKILFVIKNKIPDKIYDEKYNFINMERFIDPDFKKDNKQKLRFMQKCYKSIIDEAVKYFKEAENINLNIENIYASSVSLDKKAEKDKCAEEIIKKIFV